MFAKASNALRNTIYSLLFLLFFFRLYVVWLSEEGNHTSGGRGVFLIIRYGVLSCGNISEGYVLDTQLNWLDYRCICHLVEQLVSEGGGGM